MDFLFQQYNGTELWMIIVMMIDNVLFAFFFIAVLYLSIFSFSSLIKRDRRFHQTKKQYRYLILFPITTPESQIVNSVTTFLTQDYPKSHYDILVISNHKRDEINRQLQQLEVKVLCNEKEHYTKAEAIRLAMDSTPEKTYHMVVLLDDDSITDPTFITQINNSYASGSMAIQTHRLAKDTMTDTALFEAVSQEINNSIFREGHVNLGFSSALAGSGMAFEFDWLRENIRNVQGDNLEKQLEIMLLEQFIFIEYLADVMVYCEKTNTTESFNQQRALWIMERLQNIERALRKLPSALVKRNIDFCDKLFQWMMPSRTLLMGELFLLTLLFTFVFWPLSLKWWAIDLLLIFSFSIAMPDHFIDARFIKALKTMPLLFLLTLVNTLKILKLKRFKIKKQSHTLLKES